MRGTTGKTLFAPAMALLFAAGALQGCIFGLGGPLAKIPDSQMTAESFDDTIAFEPAGDAKEAAPPLEVHELDESQVAAAGGKKVVDGRSWLGADDFERNDILNLVEEVQPKDTILVIVVATGDIWQVPLAGALLLPDGVRPWSGAEYDELAEYDDDRFDEGPLTLPQFTKITSVAHADLFPPISYVHNFGALGYREITSRQGFQVALAATWLRETPAQRYLRMAMLTNYYARLPQFQGEGNQLAFGVMVPAGGLYVMPHASYRTLVAQNALRAWTAYEIYGLPTTILFLDRAIKNSRLLLDKPEAP
jgi:hypothetical protein